ncbi:hypothetical protein LEN26_000022 [Aphanomyces euteiches]|nr:hypothetical protein AeMF1_002006 [Aphanomyces euteiches]KAH9164474.1 hypothetical protein LEN26_000022 [Aphanomyces euteiches]KAH9181796.1 hypothetical protein AeNC1_016230 [Aphanomyces euteiches]
MDDGDADMIHRPLLFSSKGYASSQMLLDDAHRRSRHLHPNAELETPHNPMLQGPLAPRLRLETLSSSAATAVLSLTYLAFGMAIALPYLHSIGYLSKSVDLPGDLCPADTYRNACTYIDWQGSNAWWAANVSNVSWLAGSMALDMTPRNLNSSEKSFVLEFDVYVYGGHFPLPGVKRNQWILARFNQSVWIHCPHGICERATLFDISQDNEGLGGNGYGSYLIVVLYHGYYPNLFAHSVDYFFSFTQPAIFASELIIRTVLFACTLITLPWWLYRTAYLSSMLPVQKSVFALGLVLLFYQNPIYTMAQWYRTVNDTTRFASALCQSFGSALLRLSWLFLMDHPLSASSTVLKLLFGLADLLIHATMCVFHFPQLFGIGRHEIWYTALGFLTVGLTWLWLWWILSICLSTVKTLQQLIYMVSRDQQLSYRFLFLELFLIFVYVFFGSVAQIVILLHEWLSYGTNPFILASVASFSVGAQPVEKVFFVSILVYMTLFVHLPPTAMFLGSTSFYVQEAHRVNMYDDVASDSSKVFCLETAEWVVQLAWQAYLDPLGNPSASGGGIQTLENFGYELIVHLRHELLDTQAIVCMDRTKKRLVVAFRGSVSKAHWKTNMRFHQVPLWINSMQGFKNSAANSCRARAMRWASRVPLLNLALPRVHSGFWKAYAAVRNDLKETLRLLLDDYPDLTLFMTGHSMGGALAILAAYDCAVHFNIDVNMYNFGGPRVGNPAFVRQYNRAVPNSYRVVLDGDLVAGIPKFWGLYQHVGTEVAIDEMGNLIVDPSFIERRLQQRTKTRVAVHGMMMYRSMLRKCFDNLEL